ncbi:MAG TPA: hypothetical protein VGS58_21585 [Candidatus Sulfopaludibacter sp.]|nr:hypothetical protein [Candidatus Sulfopaludibacter sp.]
MTIRNSVLCVLALAAGALAQGPPPRGARGMMGGGPGGPGARFLGAEPGRPGRVVKNAPYSADVVTESTQTLADGNHIRQTNTSHVYRDGEGRTRQEQSLNGLSAIAGSANLPPVVFIHDPVAGVSYALNPNDKTATRSANRIGRGGRGGQAQSGGTTGASAAGNGQVRDQMAPVRMYGGVYRQNMQNVKTESLGKQTIEGVVADGTRTTLTIPAGQMGNEQPIQVVNERWYSADLQTVVMSKHSDPRTGETVTRLANVNRSEPSPTLFQVPADYKVSEDTRPRPAGPPRQQ